MLIVPRVEVADCSMVFLYPLSSMVPGACDNLVGGAVRASGGCPRLGDCFVDTRSRARGIFFHPFGIAQGECHDAATREEVSHRG